MITMLKVGSFVRTLVDTPYLDGGNRHNNSYPKGTIGIVSYISKDWRIIVVPDYNRNNTHAPYYRSLHLEEVQKEVMS